MNRRRFLELAAGSSSIIAGCSSGGSDAPTDSTISKTTAPLTSSPTRSPPATPTETSTQTDTPQPNSDTIFVSPDGSDHQSGDSEAPLGSIQEAVNRAYPGDTIHVKDGEYDESIQTVRAGSPEDPITITGSANAVIRGGPDPYFVFLIRHSHIHLRGLTINGLQNPDRPDNPSSYMQTLIHSLPPFDTDEYLEDLVIAPAGIGNAGRPLMLFNRTKNLEIGPLRVIGLAGAEYILGDIEDHVGEIVYLGKPPGTALGIEQKPGYPWGSLDETRHVHVHHIDNSDGHPHSELVNTKLGTRDVLVEYCSDWGGSQNSEPRPSASIRFQSYNATVRWSELRNGQGYGIHVQAGSKGILSEVDDPAVSQDTIGTGHSIYGNRIVRFDDGSLRFDATTPEKQKVLCGNYLPDLTDRSPTEPCPESIPTGDGIGHIGGNSPWA